MSLRESPAKPVLEWLSRADLDDRLQRWAAAATPWQRAYDLVLRARRLHPLVAYRVLALAIALVIITSDLHAESSLSSNVWVVLLATGHLVVTALIARRIDKRPASVNLAVMAVDVAVCVLLVSMTYGWRGPFWLYSISAVFLPAFRFGWRGALISVTVFDVIVLVANADRIRATTRDGFGGDLLARMVLLYIVAGAIALTAESLAKVTALAAETERNRIARDLHDGVGKTMGGISLEARSLSHWIERDPIEARRRARYVARISEKAALEVRDVIRGLRESEASAQLMMAIRSIVDGWSREHPGLTMHVQLNGPDAEVPVLIHGEVVRMLTELLGNVAQHASATDVRVRVTLSSAGVTLAVRDNGVGFDTGQLDPWSDEGHFGLLGARERATMLGGRFRLISSPRDGTEVTVDLPLTPREDRPVLRL